MCALGKMNGPRVVGPEESVSWHLQTSPERNVIKFSFTQLEFSLETMLMNTPQTLFASEKGKPRREDRYKKIDALQTYSLLSATRLVLASFPYWKGLRTRDIAVFQYIHHPVSPEIPGVVNSCVQVSPHDCLMVHGMVYTFVEVSMAVHEPLKIFWDADAAHLTQVSRMLPNADWTPIFSACGSRHSCRVSCIIISERGVSIYPTASYKMY